MCGRYSLATPDPAALRARFPLGESVAVAPRYNIAPGSEVLAVLAPAPGAPAGPALLRWGFVPHWAKDPAIGFKMINARAETVAEKPAYRDAFRRRRCLLLADGFYEWERLPGRRQPHRVTRADGQPFAFAGLWSLWRDPAGRELATCTIVTTEASPAIARIHPRMPVILPRDAESAWLDLDTAAEELHDLLRPLPPAELAVAAVCDAVNDARYDGPDCLLPAGARHDRLFSA